MCAYIYTYMYLMNRPQLTREQKSNVVTYRKLEFSKERERMTEKYLKK